MNDGRTVIECVFIGLALLGMVAGWSRITHAKELRARTTGWIALFVGSVIIVTMTLRLENYIPWTWCCVELALFSLAFLTYVSVRAYRRRNWQTMIYVASFASLEIGLTACVLNMSTAKTVFLAISNFGNAIVVLGFGVPAIARWTLRKWRSRMASATVEAAHAAVGLPT